MIGIAVAVAGMAMSAYGSYKASKEKEAVAKYNASVAKADGIAQKQAIDMEARIKLSEKRKVFSTGQAEMANRGISSEGSPMLIQAEAYGDIVADQTELLRQGQIARIRGDAGMAQLNRQADAEGTSRGLNLMGQGLTASSSLITAYQNNQTRQAQIDSMNNSQMNASTNAGA